MIFILSIGSTAVFYSAWYMNLPFLSLDWFLYCLAWVPLAVLLISVYKYDQKKKSAHDLATAKVSTPPYLQGVLNTVRKKRTN